MAEKIEQEQLSEDSKDVDKVVEVEGDVIALPAALDVPAIVNEAGARVQLMHDNPNYAGNPALSFSGRVLQAKADSDLALSLAIKALADASVESGKTGPYYRRKLGPQVAAGAWNAE